MNNRQANNGRRRGRGGQGQGQRGGNPNQGNRIDNRARGNAAQLLEKYKNLARDAQMQGDRVNTEYYLQFADHYFRVLAESRSRFEEQNPGQQQPGRRPSTDIDLYDDEFDNDGGEGQRGSESDAGDEEPRGGSDGYDRSEQRDNRRNRDDRPRDDRPRDDRQREDRPREDRPREDRQRDDRPREGQRQRYERNERRPAGNFRNEGEVAETPAPTPANEDEAPRSEQPRRRGRPRREEADAGDAAGIAAILPPALGVEGEVVAEAKPRRRRVKKDEGEPEAAE
jgi:hypothetical protein